MSSCKSCEGPSLPNCPAKMADGRAFTDYRPRCPVNSELYKLVGSSGAVGSSYESRVFLQRNAESIMAAQRQNAIKNMSPCAPCTRPFTDEGTRAGSERYVVRCNGVTCTREEVNNGIGIGDTVRTYN